MSEKPVWEETWDWDEEKHDAFVDEVFIVFGPGGGHSFGEWAEKGQLAEQTVARARLAAAAPEAIRLLLEAEWSGGHQAGIGDGTDPCCPWCDEEPPRHIYIGKMTGGHAHDCRLVAVLRPSGVRVLCRRSSCAPGVSPCGHPNAWFISKPQVEHIAVSTRCV